MKKTQPILPYYLISCIFAFVFAVGRLVTGDKRTEILIDMIPSLFLLQAFKFPGSNEAFLDTERYISTIFLVMFVLFPFVVKYKKTFIGIIVLLIGLCLFSYNASTNTVLIGTNRNIRGLKDICLGIGCFYACGQLKASAEYLRDGL